MYNQREYPFVCGGMNVLFMLLDLLGLQAHGPCAALSYNFIILYYIILYYIIFTLCCARPPGARSLRCITL